VLAAITGWRYVIRIRNPKELPVSFLSVGFLLTGLVLFQVYLGDLLVWVYGLHTVPVVEAIKEGGLI
jgi:uncharacterized membrane protein